LNTALKNYEIEEVSRDDPILRPYKGCPLWRQNVKKNPETYETKNKFLNTHHVENMMNELREATQTEYLDFKDVELIYTMCGYETAWRHQLFDGKSIWCSVFKNENHLKIMEYVEDLDYYYIDGPGFEITRKVACQTVNDLINFLDPADKSQKLSFYFTHSGTILKLLTFLELYGDVAHLSGEQVNHERNWKTSHIDSFATNIIAVLYE
jgi:Histidine phosphatase superfamily (branch 2)